MIRILAMISFSILSIGLLTSSTMISYQNPEGIDRGLTYESDDVTAISSERNLEKLFTQIED